MNDALQDPRSLNVDNLIERSILDVGIPPCPIILDKFTTESRRDDPDFSRLAAIISTDVGIAAGLIKTANSPFFGIRQHVRSVNEALAILGLKTTSRAVAGIILRKSFPNLHNLERFWDASARIAHLSGWLAQNMEIRGLNAEDTYTYGLFRDCGIPVLLSRFPEYEKLLATANSDAERGFTEIEDEQMPTNHAMVGCLLARSWWLPEEICLAIRNHHNLVALESANSKLPIQSRRLIATAQLAEYILQQNLGLSMTQEWNKLGAACQKILNLDDAQLDALCIGAACIVEVDES